MLDRLAIGNRAPLLDAQTQRKNLARNERKMSVLNVAKQKLGAGVHQGDAHRDREANVERPTPNVQCRTQTIIAVTDSRHAVPNLRFGVRCWAFGVFCRITRRSCLVSCESAAAFCLLPPRG